ncbi:MAG: hypothetical protein IKP07_01670 [Bacilli bacterium]|nr:hypothetical protein [Bacilli bacterium]
MYLLSFCTDMRNTLNLVGKILNIFRVVIPLLIVIFGMIDLGKAVVGSKDEDIKKAAKQLLMRFIAGLVIFFIPELVKAVFNLLGNTIDADYKTCIDAISGK